MEKSKIRSFRKILRKFERLNMSVNKGCCPGITMPQCQALLEIDEMSQATTIELARNMNLDKSTLSRTVEELVKKGFVERKPHHSDRRFILLELSEQGKKLTESINKDNDNFYLQVFQRIPLNKREDIIKKFEILVEAMGTSKQNKDKNNSCCE